MRGVRARDVRPGPAGEHVGLYGMRGRAVFERGGGDGGGDVQRVPRGKSLDQDAGVYGEWFYSG